MEAFDLPFEYNIDLEELIPLVVVAVAQATKLGKCAPRNTSLPGCVYLNELLQNGTPRCIYDALRMQKETFFKLCNWLESNTDIETSRHISAGGYVPLDYQLLGI